MDDIILVVCVAILLIVINISYITLVLLHKIEENTLVTISSLLIGLFILSLRLLIPKLLTPIVEYRDIFIK